MNYLISIHNLRHESPIDQTDFIVDRRSPVGNPFLIGQLDSDGKNPATRDEVCDKYDTWARANENSAFTSFMDSLYFVLKKFKKLRLYCWCVPERCHVMTIKNILMERLKKDELI